MQALIPLSASDNEKYELAENDSRSYTILPKAVHVTGRPQTKPMTASAAEVTLMQMQRIWWEQIPVES